MNRMLGNNQTIRYFKNPILEKLAYTNLTTVNIVYIPVIVLFSYFSITQHSTKIIIAGLLAGLFLWTFVEYCMHRFAFHFIFTNKSIKRVHSIFHLSHHDFPNDQRKYQTLLLLSLPAGFLFYFLLKCLISSYVDPIFTGFALGYVLYEFTHYSTHRFKMDSKIFKSLKQHHMHHHFLNMEKNFGVTSAFWDYIFRTRLSNKEKLLILQKRISQ